jgi:hypothetical protein
MFDASDEQFGEAVELFKNTLAEPLERIIVQQRWPKAVVFTEFWGDKSFAGNHEPDDPKKLTVIDVSPHQRGILNPKQFLDLFEEFGPNYLGNIKWTSEFINNIKKSNVDGITFEGVVGKVFKKKELIMYKAKTQAWRNGVMKKFGEKEGKEIINS